MVVGRPSSRSVRGPQAARRLLGHDLHVDRALPSSAVQARCWSRPTSTTGPRMVGSGPAAQ
jgi:hypothetical protein